MRKPLLHHVQDYFFPHPRNGHHPRLFGATSVAVLALTIIALEGAYLFDTKFVFLKTDFLASVLPSALVELTNADRQADNVPTVTEDPLLDAAAQAAAEDMAAKGYFAHNSPDGKTPWYWLDQAGYKYSYAGQNLAIDFVDSTDVQTAWMNSPTHRANVLKPQYTAVGFGTANGMYEGKETTFVVEYFAAPVPPKVEPVHVAAAPPARAVVLPVATTTARVLSSETAKQSTSVPVPVATHSWFERMLASPFFAFSGLLSALLAIIAVSWSTTLFSRGTLKHWRVAAAGTFLTLLVAGAMLGASLLGGSVEIVTANGQGAAAVIAAR